MKLTGLIKQDKLIMALTPEILFELSNEERQHKFEEIIADLKIQMV